LRFYAKKINEYYGINYKLMERSDFRQSTIINRQ